jgi:hypothetical protein
MARYFDITALTTLISLDDQRKGQASFTVTNATTASIRGDAVVMPKSGAKPEWFTIDHPSRHYDPGASEQLTVSIDAGMDATPATYGFQLRVLLGGGVPEEQYDDGPLVKFDVEEVPTQPPVQQPVKKPFPWWIVAVIGVIAVLVILAGVWFFFLREKPLTGDAVRIVSAHPGAGSTLRTTNGTVVSFDVQYSFASAPYGYVQLGFVDYGAASNCTGSTFGTGGLYYLPVDGPNGHITINALWTSNADGRMAPKVWLYDQTGSTVVDSPPDGDYCYHYVP